MTTLRAALAVIAAVTLLAGCAEKPGKKKDDKSQTKGDKNDAKANPK